MAEKITMTEDDTALIDGEYRDFEEDETCEVPEWVARSFKDKGTAVDAEMSFDPADERETKPSTAHTIEAEPTTENSAWYQFRKPDGTLVMKGDGEVLKAHGADERDEILDSLNE